MTDYVQQEATPNLLLREILTNIQSYQNGPAEGDAALAHLHVVQAKFLELHRYLRNGGQFPREWITRNYQFSAEHWERVGRG